MSNHSSSCILCKSPAKPLTTGDGRRHLDCPQCGLIHVPRDQHLTVTQEFERYQLHVNCSEDPRYQKFFQGILEDFDQLVLQGGLKPAEAGSILDFGSGEDSALVPLLRERGWAVACWDPYYHSDSNVLNEKYSVVFATEVVEHFRNPMESWGQLVQLVKPGGSLFVMTRLLVPEINFESWFYRRDPTHLAFYRPQTIQWLARHFGLEVARVTAPDRMVFVASEVARR